MTRSRYAKGEKRGKPADTPQTEIDYALILEARKRLGEIIDYRHHGLTLLLADKSNTGTRAMKYSPDFFVMAADHVIECHECKGPHTREDAWIKLKLAADQWPFRFFLCVRESDSDPWDIRQV